MNQEPFDLNDPAFRARCADVHRDLEAGVTMSLGDIADALDMPFDIFAQFLAAEMFRQGPNLDGVVVGEIVREALH
jgi:hypothetical protein